MPHPDLVYITYIRTTPEKLFQALTDPAFTKQYFGGVAFDTDWKPHSKIHVPGPDGPVLWGTVLQVDPPRLLSYTFDGPAHGKAGAGRSTVATFEVEPHGEGVRLHLTHSRLEPMDVDLRRDTFHGLVLRPSDAKGDYL
jgi:uncharacterized protein YndB with AHSA1/START domain